MATSHESVKCICSDKTVIEVDPKTWKSNCGTFLCLKDILDVLKSDMVFEGVEVSFTSLKLIAKNVSTKSQAIQLVCVVADRLKSHLDPMRRSLVEKMTKEIADGFQVNKCFDQDDLLEFIYELLDDGLNNRSQFPEVNATMISECALEVLHKRMEIGELNQELIDPFLPLVIGCLANQPLLPSALRGLKSLLRFPLPSLREEGDSLSGLGATLVRELSQIAAGEKMDISLDCSLSCYDLLKSYISKDMTVKQLSELIRFPRLFASIESDRHYMAVSLVDALIQRRFEFKDLNHFVSKVSLLLIHTGAEHISLKCQQILVDYVAHYTLSDQILDGHIDIMLRYAHPEDGTKMARALTMVKAFISVFSESGLVSKMKYLHKAASRLFAALLTLIPRDADPFEAPSPAGELIGFLINSIHKYRLGVLVLECLSAFNDYPAAVAEVLVYFMKPLDKSFRKHLTTILQKVKGALNSDQSYYSLSMVLSTLKYFKVCHVLYPEFKEMWTFVFKSLLHTESRLRHISCKLLKEYFSALKKKKVTSSHTLVATLFTVAADLCFVLKEHTSSVCELDLTENIVYVLSALHSWIGQLDQATCDEFWLRLGKDEQDMFCKAFKVLDPEKEVVVSTDLRDIKTWLIGNLLTSMGKLALEKESVEMRVVFGVYKSFIQEEKECHLYAPEVMFPLCKVCEGFAGENISVELKELGENVRDSLTSANEIFGKVYGEIRESLQAKKKRAGEGLGKAAQRRKIK